ncbi:MAG: hypothetical protein EXS10_06380 [Phycisphaerales bacterium]|nr:hypothetical protein [Phycisphaerales bacterium]
MRRCFLSLFTFAFATNLALASDDLDRALALIPDDAIACVIAPAPKKSNADCTGLLEQLGIGGAIIAGRPIDHLKALLGMSANVDESVPIVLYSAPVNEAGEPSALVFIVGTTDPIAFMQTNFTPEGEPALGRYKTSAGVVLSARAVGQCVIASSSADAVLAYDMSKQKSLHDRLQGRLTVEEWKSLDRADVIFWANNDGLRAGSNIARESAPADARDAVATTASTAIVEELSDAVVAIDIDPLGVWIRAIGVAKEGSALAKLAATREGGAPAQCSRLPGNPFYLAASVDCVGLGGTVQFIECLELFGVDRALLPEWILADGADITSVQFAAYPSKLGVAVGGVLNDSALFIASRNPQGTLAHMKESFLALKGEASGVKRDPQWTDSKTLKSGAVASAFELKETIVDMSKMAPGSEYMRLGMQFVVGVRGLVGLAAATEGGVVVTFSQRPDVFGRALAAGVAAGDAPLSEDATLRSMEEWMPPKRDIEVFFGVGRLAMLASSVMKGLGSAFGGDGAASAISIPTPDPALEPLAMSLEIGANRLDGSMVLPAGVLKYFAAMYAQRSAAGASSKASASAARESGAEANPEESSAQ